MYLLFLRLHFFDTHKIYNSINIYVHYFQKYLYFLKLINFKIKPSYNMRIPGRFNHTYEYIYVFGTGELKEGYSYPQYLIDKFLITK